MEAIVIAVGTALVGAMATDSWARARDAVVTWWRQVRPEHADEVSRDLDQLRAEAVTARNSGDTATSEALAGAWRMRLHRLLTENPDLRSDLERLRDDLTPIMNAGDRNTVEAITQVSNVKGKGNTVVQGGGDVTSSFTS